MKCKNQKEPLNDHGASRLEQQMSLTGEDKELASFLLSKVESLPSSS